MKNFVEKGLTFRFTAGADTASGDVVIVGDLVGISVTDAKSGDEGVAHAEGVYRLPKATGGAIGQGAKVYWDSANSNVVTAASGNTLIGRAWNARLAGDTDIDVKILPRV